jgi:hypothetical protein
MGQCVQCNDFFPPHFMVDIEPKDEDVDKKNLPQKCAFCYLDKKEVTLVYEEKGKEEVISKEEAKKRYQIFLKQIIKNKKIEEILNRKTEPTLVK